MKTTYITAPIRHKRMVAAAIALLIAGLVIHQLTAPVHGRTVPVDVAVAKPKPASGAASLPATNDDQTYFTLSLPAGYRAQEAQNPGGGLLYAQTIVKPSDFGSLLISIGIKQLGEGGLDEDSSYRLRSQQSARYKLTVVTVQGEQVHITNDSQSAGVIAFWPHGNYLATISVSQGIDEPASGGNPDELQVLQTLLAAWHWKV